ncbi:hypothetical protein LA073_004882 [Escherichia coli]|nr:hypothetical protein [Escherichia coli]EIC9952151.1 hypothetical protein [Escherichia coli]EKI1254984.1 hypothetical protein [Escherichia coli]MDA5369308.1 hypothetical protein [Escherichia coli]
MKMKMKMKMKASISRITGKTSLSGIITTGQAKVRHVMHTVVAAGNQRGR